MQRLLRAALLALAAFAASFGAFAKSNTCLPVSNWGPTTQSGGKLMEGRDNTIKGDWYALWCPDATGSGWTLKTHAVLDKYKTLSPAAVFQLGLKIWGSDTPMLDLRAMIDANTILPPSGTQDRFDFESLHYTACTQGAALPPIAGPMMVNCLRPLPVPPPPVPTVQYIVTSKTAYPLKPDGTRNTNSFTSPATLGAPCDCVAKLIKNPYGGQWCKVDVPGASIPLVAGCSVKK